MKSIVHRYGKSVDVVFQDHGVTMHVFCFDQAECNDLAEHLREIADELSPTTETP